MSTAGNDDIVLFCECGHKSPQNEICQYVPKIKCGGAAKCVICRGRVIGEDEIPPAVPPVDPPAVEPIIDELPEYREPNGGV